VPFLVASIAALIIGFIIFLPKSICSMIHWFFSIDTNVLGYLYSIRSLPLTYFFIDVSELGRWQIILGFAAAISLMCLLFKRYADIVGIFSAFIGSAGVILILKYAVQRPRPDWWYQAYLEGPYYSFPSAHAGLAFAFYGFCVYLLLQSISTKINRAMVALFPIIILFVGFSRLYLGVHYVSDVIAGFAIGAFFVYVGMIMRVETLRRLDSLHE
jgi:undecaprenyl-diphosphatase